MSRRKEAKALARWDDEARGWATATGRHLALDLYYDRETAPKPYGVGVVLDAGEKVWAEVPVRFNLDWPPLVKPGSCISSKRGANAPSLGSIFNRARCRSEYTRLVLISNSPAL